MEWEAFDTAINRLDEALEQMRKAGNVRGKQSGVGDLLETYLLMAGRVSYHARALELEGHPLETNETTMSTFGALYLIASRGLREQDFPRESHIRDEKTREEVTSDMRTVNQYLADIGFDKLVAAQRFLGRVASPASAEKGQGKQ